MASADPRRTKTRAETQREVNAFALFMFAWQVTYSRPSDTFVFPLTEDLEELARYAIRHFLLRCENGPQSFQPFLDTTVKALHARFFFMHSDIKEYAMDEVRSLLAEELSSVPYYIVLQS